MLNEEKIHTLQIPNELLGLIKRYLQGREKVPTGGKAREPMA